MWRKKVVSSRKARGTRKWHKEAHQEGNYGNVTDELDCRSSLKDRSCRQPGLSRQELCAGG